MPKSNMLLGLMMLMLLPAQGFALQIRGVELPENITQEITQTSLVLNGAGVRSRFVFNIYVAALYLTERSSDAGQILAQTAPKRFSMHFVYDRIEQAKITAAWSEGFAANLNAGQLAALKPEIDAFNAAFGDTVKGDVVIIDFLPDQTTLVTINDSEKARIKGVDFQRALLAIWLGGSPVDRRLKNALLGQD